MVKGFSKIHRLKCYVFNSYQLSLIESAVDTHASCLLAAAASEGSDVKVLYLLNKKTNITFLNQIMHNFKIGFNFTQHFLKSNLYLGAQ